MLKKKLKCTCYRADGSVVPTNEKGQFDPPLKLPLEIHIDLLKILNPGIKFTVILEEEK